jgi:hypothetical protein
MQIHKIISIVYVLKISCLLETKIFYLFRKWIAIKFITSWACSAGPFSYTRFKMGTKKAAVFPEPKIRVFESKFLLITRLTVSNQ